MAWRWPRAAGVYGGGEGGYGYMTGSAAGVYGGGEGGYGYMTGSAGA